MRSEFKEYYLTHKAEKHFWTISFKEALLKKLFLQRFKKLDLGSERWHIMQHKISMLSASTFDCEVRSLFYETTMDKQCKGQFYCLPGVCLNFPKRIKIGFNLFLNRNVNIVARDYISIGDNVIIGPNTVINSGSHIYSNPLMLIRDQGHKKAPISIEDDVFIGANVVVLPGVTIGRGSVIGAGSVVTKSITPYSIAVGIPAKVIKRRS